MIFFSRLDWRAECLCDEGIAGKCCELVETYPPAINFTPFKGQPLERLTNCLFRSPASHLWILLHNWHREPFWLLAILPVDEHWRTWVWKCLENLHGEILIALLFPWLSPAREHCYHLFMVLWAMDYNTIFYSLNFLSIQKGLLAQGTKR